LGNLVEDENVVFKSTLWV